jgi:hypothetical protein
MIFFCVSIVKKLLAPTLSSVRKKPSSNDLSPIEETLIGEDDEDDPMVTNLEQDETETETQRKRYSHNFPKISLWFFLN